MRVLYVLQEGGDNYNGASRSAVGLITELSKAGVQFFVVTPGENGIINNELAKIPGIIILPRRYYRWVVRRPSRFPRNVYSNLDYFTRQSMVNYCVAKNLARFIYDNQIDLVHTNSSVVNIGAEAARLAGVPHIWHVREFGNEDFGMAPYVSSKRYFKYMESHSEAIVCISEAIASKYRGKVSDDVLHVVYNGVPIPPESIRSVKNYRTEPITMLIAGRLSEKKGQRIAVDALFELLNNGYENLNLIIAGSGDSACLGENLEKCGSHVDLVGYVHDLTSIRQKADIELMCSYSEGFGRGIIEAMASGPIVIAASGGAVPEIIVDGLNGLLFNPGNSHDLAEKIIKVLGMSEDECRNIRRNGYLNAERRFSVSTNANNMLEAYRACL